MQSYDNWHFWGIRKASIDRPVSRGRSAGNSLSSSHSPDSGRPKLRTHRSSGSETSAATALIHQADLARDIPVIGRVSTHTLRIEREWQLCKLIIKKSDPESRHFIRPLEFVKLPPKPGNTTPLVAFICEAPGPNYLKDMVRFGPNAYKATHHGDAWMFQNFQYNSGIPLLTFLDFAVGAAESLEILHHGHQVVHGEIRGDAFHFAENGMVRMINFGGGARTFENGLTSAGWNVLSKEVGVEMKLAFIAPEQTGRMP